MKRHKLKSMDANKTNYRMNVLVGIPGGSIGQVRFGAMVWTCPVGGSMTVC